MPYQMCRTCEQTVYHVVFSKEESEAIEPAIEKCIDCNLKETNPIRWKVNQFVKNVAKFPDWLDIPSKKVMKADCQRSTQHESLVKLIDLDIGRREFKFQTFSSIRRKFDHNITQFDFDMLVAAHLLLISNSIKEYKEFINLPVLLLNTPRIWADWNKQDGAEMQVWVDVCPC